MSEPRPDKAAESNTLFTDVLERLVRREPLSAALAEAAFGVIMDGAVCAERIAAFLMALRVQGETPDELLGAVIALRQRMSAVPDLPSHTVDVCGTGGDGYGTLNVSTAVAFVLAGAGVPVAKHGNRAVSSLSGASDVLGALGVPLLAEPVALQEQMRAHRAIFLAAPNHHPAMRHAAQARKALGLPTLFNLVGPLVNPAGVTRQLVGVFSPSWLRAVVTVLHRLGSERVWAVCGLPSAERSGIDEVTLAGPTQVEAMEDGRVHSFAIEPEMAGLAYAPVSAIQGGNAQHNAQALEELLRGAHGAYRDTVLLNAACALHVAGRICLLKEGRPDPYALREGVAEAARTLDNGAALAVLEGLRAAGTAARPER